MKLRLRASLVWSEEAIVALAEYVGANMPINESLRPLLEPHLKNYQQVYRVWSSLRANDYLLSKHLAVPAKMFYATTQDVGAILKMGEESDLEDCLVSKHSGLGLEPISILQRALDSGLTTEASFVRDVIKQNAYQREVLLFSPISELNSSNVIGYYNLGSIKRFP